MQKQAALLVFHCRSLTPAARIVLTAEAVTAVEFGAEGQLLWVALSDASMQCFHATAGEQHAGHKDSKPMYIETRIKNRNENKKIAFPQRALPGSVHVNPAAQMPMESSQQG